MGTDFNFRVKNKGRHYLCSCQTKTADFLCVRWGRIDPCDLNPDRSALVKPHRQTTRKIKTSIPKAIRLPVQSYCLYRIFHTNKANSHLLLQTVRTILTAFSRRMPSDSVAESMSEQSSGYLAKRLQQNWMNRYPDKPVQQTPVVDPDDSLTNLNWLQVSLNKSSVCDVLT